MCPLSQFGFIQNHSESERALAEPIQRSPRGRRGTRRHRRRLSNPARLIIIISERSDTGTHSFLVFLMALRPPEVYHYQRHSVDSFVSETAFPHDIFQNRPAVRAVMANGNVLSYLDNKMSCPWGGSRRTTVIGEYRIQQHTH